jgi:hypothetical protein
MVRTVVAWGELKPHDAEAGTEVPARWVCCNAHAAAGYRANSARLSFRPSKAIATRKRFLTPFLL